MKELETVQFGPGLRKFLGSHSEQGFLAQPTQGTHGFLPGGL